MIDLDNVKQTLFVRGFGLLKVPLLFFIRPTVEEMTNDKVVFRVPYRRRNLNHLNSMYFGVLAAGADLAGGFLAVKNIRESGEKLSLVFKDFHADFHKRAEGDTLFTCTDGPEIRDLVAKAIETGERQNCTVNVVATCPSKLGDEPVASFKLTLSVKKSDKKVI